MEDLQAIYVALLNRPADPEGLLYFTDATQNGQNYDALAAITLSEEYEFRFSGQQFDDIDNLGGDYAREIYEAMFNRTIDSTEFKYWSDRVNSGESTKQTIVLDILGGIRGTDLENYNEKVRAADELTALIDTPEEIAAYRGGDAAEFGHNLLAKYSFGTTVENESVEAHWNAWYSPGEL